MFDAEINLHDFNLKTPEEVKYHVEHFIDECFATGCKNIRIITGRGVHSKSRPLVKPLTESILKSNTKVANYKLDSSMGAFEILLIN
jgi:DNA-nicking Smr family endonuclease